MAYNPQMPQQAQQMPQQGQAQGQPQQWQNPAANWQRTYQNSQWARPVPQYQQMPYQQNPYQSQMPQQMPQQYQQQQQFQMPQFSQQQINQFLSYMQSRPMPNFMGDPRYQAQQSQKPVYQPTQSPAMNPRTYVPEIKFMYGSGYASGRPMGYTSGDAAADAWVKQRNPINMFESGVTQQQREQRTRDLYNQYYAGA